MSVRRKTTIILTALLASTLWGAGLGPAAAADPSPANPGDSPALVTTAKPHWRTFSMRIPWVGTVVPISSVELKALTEGRIEAIEVEDQIPLAPGTTVATLGGAQMEGERTRLKADIDSLQTRLKLAGQTVDRLRKSLKSQLATRDQVAAARAEQVTLRTQLQEARLKRDLFEKKTRITAPVGGTFTGRTVNVGQEVEAGQVIGAIVDPDHLRIEASLFPPPDAELEGKEATIHLSGEQKLKGRVRSVLPLTSKTGAVRVWIEGPEIDGRLRPGETVGGHLELKTDKKSLAVPATAVVYDEEENVLLFIRKNGSYEALPVQTGRTQEGWTEILSGLQADQVVVTEGAYELFYRHFNEQFKVPD